jgi:hypothetical protein
MPKRAALVTLCIGEKYTRDWEHYCEPSWRAYADHHGFELVTHNDVIEPPQHPSRGLAWQKLLIGTLEKVRHYPHVIWLDADIVINTMTMPPDILKGLPEGKIGAVRYHALLRHQLFESAHRQICAGQTYGEFNKSLLKDHHLDGDPSCMINTGVLVIPRERYDWLAEVYSRHRSRPSHAQQQEQVIASHELHANRLTHFLDDRFNAVWYEYKYGVYFGDAPAEINRAVIQHVLSQVYFLHFAGNQQDMRLLTAPPGVEGKLTP